MPIVDFPLAALRDVAMGLVFVLFVLSAIVLTVVVLIQEGKGGGLGSAFGGAAADAFGVKAGTVNKLTAYLAASFLGLALLYAGLSAGGDKVRIGPEPQPLPGLSTPITPEPASPESASPESASPESASPEPASPEPAGPEPAGPEPGGEGNVPPPDRAPPVEVPGEGDGGNGSSDG